MLCLCLSHTRKPLPTNNLKSQLKLCIKSSKMKKSKIVSKPNENLILTTRTNRCVHRIYGIACEGLPLATLNFVLNQWQSLIFYCPRSSKWFSRVTFLHTVGYIHIYTCIYQYHVHLTTVQSFQLICYIICWEKSNHLLYFLVFVSLTCTQVYSED